MTASPDQTAADKIRGRLLILAAAFLWSSSGFFAKAPLFDAWPREERGLLLAFWRAVFATLALAPLVRRPQWSLALVPMTLIFAAMNFTYLSAMVYSTAANAIWLQNTAPIWVFVVGVFCFGERALPRDWLLLLFGICGVGIILFFEIGQSLSADDATRRVTTLGLTYGVLGGLTYGGVVLSLRGLREFDPAWLIALNHGVTALILLPFAWRCEAWPAGHQWWFLAAFGALQMGLPYFLFARGLRHIPGHEASGIVLLEPVLVPVWVFLAWRNHEQYQPPQWWTFCGGGLILTGLVLRYLYQSKRWRG